MFLLLFTRSSPRLQTIDNKVEIQTFFRGKLTVVNFGVTIQFYFYSPFTFKSGVDLANSRDRTSRLQRVAPSTYYILDKMHVAIFLLFFTIFQILCRILRRIPSSFLYVVLYSIYLKISFSVLFNKKMFCTTSHLLHYTIFKIITRDNLNIHRNKYSLFAE